MADRRVRYLIIGLLVAAFNLAAASVLFAAPALRGTGPGRNFANATATEVSLLFAFVLHAKITWAQRPAGTLHMRLLAFHIVSGLGIVARSLTFAALDFAGVSWLPATVLGICVAIPCNFVGYDRWVFQRLPISAEQPLGDG